MTDKTNNYRVSRAVIDKVSLVAAREVDGVEDVVHYETTRGLAAQKGVVATATELLNKTKFDKNYVPGRHDMFAVGKAEDAEVKMKITVRKGTNISTLTDRLKEKVENDVLSQTGVKLNGISVSVRGE